MYFNYSGKLCGLIKFDLKRARLMLCTEPGMDHTVRINKKNIKKIVSILFVLILDSVGFLCCEINYTINEKYFFLIVKKITQK